MYLLEIDQKLNRVHITLAGHFTADEAGMLLEDISRRMDELSANFRMLCDLSALERFDFEARKIYRKIMDLCNEHGAERVVRIVDDPRNNFGMSIMSYFHYDSSVQLKTCDSLSQALKLL